ncbi:MULTISPECIES: aminoglycoside 6'-N-acetyltransferase [Devosia]|uniref:aminoglycoside 6'-N-acetyltransferase n=1 Tax=Devosia TaxID=46913 RepID=UPI001FE3569B|nr:MULTISPECIES: aminoglycoside 6'-N-acetyltransferase [Devosia]
MKIAVAAPDDAPDWIAMRSDLWPGGGDGGTHADDINRLLADAGDTVNLIARDGSGHALGFAEASLRRDYVNGCQTTPVAFLEGIYVVPEARGRGVAKALVAAVEDWARASGVSELGSDAAPDNMASLKMHHALGFEETQRVVFFRKLLGA